jgi:hypothetical protein
MDKTPRCAAGHGLIRNPGECKACDSWARERELVRTK